MRLRMCVAISLIAACGPTETGSGDPDLHAVPAGKADGYLSDVASEFEVTGWVPVVLRGADLADARRRAETVRRRLTAVGLYLTAYLTDKFRSMDLDGDGAIGPGEVFFRNEGYGGLHAMVRNRTIEATAIEGDPRRGHRAHLRVLVAGPRYLPHLLAGDRDDASESVLFDLYLPAGASVDPGAVPRTEIRSFDPRTHAGPIEVLRLALRPAPGGTNAYPRFAEMVADGLLDVTIVFGYDYHPDRNDLRQARDSYEALVGLGFAAPVARFEDLRADSGPFRRTALAGGRSIRMEVRLLHADLFRGRRETQRAIVLAELARRDVFFYVGHAGPYAGFSLAPGGQAYVGPSALASVAFTRRPQLVVAEGCQTYSQYADALYANPRKDERNLDVVTTVNFSYGRSTPILLASLLRVDADGRHVPVDLDGMVRDLNADPVNAQEGVLYGVLGVDDNPRLHPYARPEWIGAVCGSDADCGDPVGNVCVRVGWFRRRCGAWATAASGCPAGSRLSLLARGDTLVGTACLAP